MNEEDYTDDVEPLDNIPTTAKLEDVGELAAKMLSLQASVDNLADKLKLETAKLDSVTKHDLPNLLDELKLKDFTLTDGTKISIKDKVVGSVRVDDRPAFFDWMHKHGYGTIVKREVAVQFGRGDAKKAGKLRGYLTRWYKDFVVQDNENIHAGTLNAWVKETEQKNTAALEEGGRVIDFPETITITHLREAVVTLPKKKGGL